MQQWRMALLVLFLFLLTLTPDISAKGGNSGGSSSGTVHVRSYMRKDGTVVRSYDRAAPGQGSSQTSTGSSPSTNASPAVSQQQRTTPLAVVQLQSRYNTSRLFLRPDSGAERLGMVPTGANLKVIENKGAWLYVETPSPDERRGWILREWIQE